MGYWISYWPGNRGILMRDWDQHFKWIVFTGLMSAFIYLFIDFVLDLIFYNGLTYDGHTLLSAFFIGGILRTILSISDVRTKNEKGGRKNANK